MDDSSPENDDTPVLDKEFPNQVSNTAPNKWVLYLNMVFSIVKAVVKVFVKKAGEACIELKEIGSEQIKKISKKE
jgi:hypothetical protein